jgi:hypothetical protein
MEDLQNVRFEHFPGGLVEAPVKTVGPRRTVRRRFSDDPGDLVRRERSDLISEIHGHILRLLDI